MQSIEVRPLTLLAGANSSGKSSMMQPLLLLKQTLEASYDAGVLLLDGPNVRFSAVEQLLSQCARASQPESFSVGLTVGPDFRLTLCFERVSGKGLHIREMTYESPTEKATFREGMTSDEVKALIPAPFKDIKGILREGKPVAADWAVTRERCFLGARMLIDGKLLSRELPFGISPAQTVEPHVRRLIHLPGLRGNPQRFYPKTAVGSTFPGVFQDYVASVLAHWQESDKDKLNRLSRDLRELGLTWKVIPKSMDDTRVELQVGRLAQAVVGGGWDLVNIADVGFGVSQSLPVVVALHAAAAGQMVYIEQPEIHLHPKAQVAMAKVLADAAKRGVHVVAETHSALLLLGIQTLVAKGDLAPEIVKLHWFRRDRDGCTEVKSADLDGSGAFGDWPEDFGETELKAEGDYLDAAHASNPGVAE
jgi:predicted ATPase